MDALVQFFEWSFEFIGAQLVAVLAYPFSPHQRIFWLYLLSSCLLTFYVYLRATRQSDGGQRSFSGFLGFLFPEEVWRNPSAWLGFHLPRPWRLVAISRSGAGRAKTLSYLFSLARLARIALARASILSASVVRPVARSRAA